MKHEIEITVLPGGKLETEVKGVSGPNCEGLSVWLEQLGEVLEHKRTVPAKKKTKEKVGIKQKVG